MPVYVATQLRAFEVWLRNTRIAVSATAQDAANALIAYANANTGTTDTTYEIRGPVIQVKVPGIRNPHTDVTPPTIPGSLAGSANSASTVLLTWLASTDANGVAGYQVWRDGSPVATTVATTFTDSGRAPGTTYVYNVSAYDATGNMSQLSNSATVTMAAGQSNNAPVWQNIAQQELTTGTNYSLNLTSLCSDADGQAIAMTQVAGTLPTGVAFNTSTKTVSGTPTAVLVTSSVTFRASDGITTVDKIIVFNCLAADTTAPTVPTGLSGLGISRQRIDLTWAASTDTAGTNQRSSGLVGYKLYRDGLLRVTLGLVTSYSDTGLATGTSYSYTIASYDVAGNTSAQSSAAVVATSNNASPQWVTPAAINAIPYPVASNVTMRLFATDDDGDPIVYRYDAPLPTGFTITELTNPLGALLTIPAGTAQSAGYTFTAYAEDTSVIALPTLTLSGGGSGKAWTFGHAFKRGDVPSGSYITATGPTSFQADVRNLWADGSVKFAVLSGVGGTSVVLSAVSGTAPTGEVALTDPQASVAFSTFNGGTPYSCPTGNTVATWNKAAAHLVRKFSGPVMTERHYYVPTSDAHLAVWFYVRSYVGGATEVETVVENGWLNTAAPGEKDYVATVRVGATVRFTSTALAHMHHTRWSRSDWVGTDPAILPQHDGAYLRATKLVPNYGFTNVTSAAFIANGAQNTWEAPMNDASPAPFARGNCSPAMGDYGFWEDIGLLPRYDVLYITSQNPVAYRSMVGNARCYGRYGTHYRDETTGKPFRFSQPSSNATYATTLGLSATANVGDKYGYEFSQVRTPDAAGGSPQTYTYTHAPAPPYVGYLVTGRWWMLEQIQLDAGYHFLLWQNTRGGASGIFQSNHCQERGTAWQTRCLALAACATPDGDPLQAEYRTSVAANATWYKNQYVGGIWDNGLHQISGYLGGGVAVRSGRPWMCDFYTGTLGWTYDLEVVSDTTNLILFRDWCYRSVIDRMGSSGFCFQDVGGMDQSYLGQISFPDGVTMGKPFNYPADGMQPNEQYANWGLVSAAGNFSSSCTIGGALRFTYGTTDLVNAYWANFWPALAYAVDHGATGTLAGQAAAGRNRIIGASNYANYGWDDNPMWSMVPR